MDAPAGQDDFGEKCAFRRKLSNLSASGAETLSLDTLLLRLFGERFAIRFDRLSP